MKKTVWSCDWNDYEDDLKTDNNDDEAQTSYFHQYISTQKNLNRWYITCPLLKSMKLYNLLKFSYLFYSTNSFFGSSSFSHNTHTLIKLHHDNNYNGMKIYVHANLYYFLQPSFSFRSPLLIFKLITHRKWK